MYTRVRVLFSHIMKRKVDDDEQKEPLSPLTDIKRKMLKVKKGIRKREARISSLRQSQQVQQNVYVNLVRAQRNEYIERSLIPIYGLNKKKQKSITKSTLQTNGKNVFMSDLHLDVYLVVFDHLSYLDIINLLLVSKEMKHHVTSHIDVNYFLNQSRFYRHVSALDYDKWLTITKPLYKNAKKRKYNIIHLLLIFHMITLTYDATHLIPYTSLFWRENSKLKLHHLVMCGDDGKTQLLYDYYEENKLLLFTSSNTNFHLHSKSLKGSIEPIKQRFQKYGCNIHMDTSNYDSLKSDLLNYINDRELENLALVKSHRCEWLDKVISYEDKTLRMLDMVPLFQEKAFVIVNSPQQLKDIDSNTIHDTFHYSRLAAYYRKCINVNNGKDRTYMMTLPYLKDVKMLDIIFNIACLCVD